MENQARGYIASGEFDGHRVPQHIQNQIVKSYCHANCLYFVLSRAEYWINGCTDCQLWAALNENYKHIVFYSIWQMPTEEDVRESIYKHCIKHKITLHFASERIKSDGSYQKFNEFEILFKTNKLVSKVIGKERYMKDLKKILRKQSS